MISDTNSQRRDRANAKRAEKRLAEYAALIDILEHYRELAEAPNMTVSDKRLSRRHIDAYDRAEIEHQVAQDEMDALQIELGASHG